MKSKKTVVKIESVVAVGSKELLGNPPNPPADRCRECGMEQPTNVHVMAHEEWCNHGKALKEESEKAIARTKLPNAPHEPCGAKNDNRESANQ